MGIHGGESGKPPHVARVVPRGVHASRSKLDNLRLILHNLRKLGAKTLIFSSHDGIFVHVERILKHLELNFAYLKGTSSVVSNVIEKYKNAEERDCRDEEEDMFPIDYSEIDVPISIAPPMQQKDDKIDVLLANMRSYGSGMNLENTTDIILFHKTDSEKERQVIGRGNRMGRRHPLRVWYLLHDNE
jgi:SNF2 family DNA or RNA helicase